MPRQPREIDLAALSELKTARLQLRPPRETDAAAVFAYGGDEQVVRYLAWPRHRSIADSRHFLRAAAAGWRSGQWLNWAIEDDTGVVGMIGAQPGRAGAGIGYVLAHKAWGRGYASEALLALSDALFAASSVNSLWAFCVPQNRASARVLERCGYQREGELPNYFVCPNMGGERHDVLLYARHREGRRSDDAR